MSPRWDFESWFRPARDAFRIKLLAKLRPRFLENMEKRDRIARLLENEDFQLWQSGILNPLAEDIRARILSPLTRGYQHDFLKSVLEVVEMMKQRGTLAAMEQMDREMERIKKEFQRKGGVTHGD